MHCPGRIDGQCMLKNGLLAFLMTLLLLTGSVPGFAIRPDPLPIPNSRFYHTLPHSLTRLMRFRLDHIYAFDREPLAQRTPVILLPGRAEEYQYAVWWKNFGKYAAQSKTFKRRYKLYLFLYNSREQVEVSTAAFTSELQDFAKAIPPATQVVLVSYSLGGVIANQAMANPLIFPMVKAHFAMAVPYHGSPVFTPNWFVPYYHSTNHSPVRQILEHVIYRAYLSDKSNLITALRWDSFDGSGPRPQASEPNMLDPPNTNVPEKVVKAKTIVYAGYLDNPYLKNGETTLALAKILATPTDLPKKVLWLAFPVYMTSVHGVFSDMNIVLSNIPVVDVKQSAKLPVNANNPNEKDIKVPVFQHSFRYNDGVIPLASELYLPKKSLPYTGNLQEMTDHLDVEKTRIFADMDHMDFTEFERNAKPKRSDMLHPNEGSRSPYEWVLYDLDLLR